MHNLLRVLSKANDIRLRFRLYWAQLLLQTYDLIVQALFAFKHLIGGGVLSEDRVFQRLSLFDFFVRFCLN